MSQTIFSEFLCEEEYFGFSFSNINTNLSFDPCTTFDLGYLELLKGGKITPPDPKTRHPYFSLSAKKIEFIPEFKVLPEFHFYSTIILAL